MVDCFQYSLNCFSLGTWVHHLYDFNRYRGLGSEPYRKLGLGYYQLCLVGRYWSRGNPDFSSIVAVPSKMENGHQPFSGGNDNIFGNSGRFVPHYTHGSSLVGVLGIADSQPIWFALGELSIHHCFGMYLRFQRIFRYHWFSGGQDCFLISQ